MLSIKVALRSSPLSKKQGEEVLKELSAKVLFEYLYVQTYGDLDQKTSLKTLPKNDFFTKEVDELVLNGHARISIHSAKDLPYPIDDRLELLALTKGKSRDDLLLLRENGLIPKIVGSSSFRREQEVKKLFPHVSFKDIRGTIGERLSLLEEGKVDAIVIAKAALDRLSISYPFYLSLGEGAPFQGKLAILGRKGDLEMKELFSSLHFPLTWHTGLRNPRQEHILHYPLIYCEKIEKISPKKPFSHVLLTSQTAVEMMQEEKFSFKDVRCISVGKKTTEAIKRSGGREVITASLECQEGVLETVLKYRDTISSIYWPHSRLSRPFLRNALLQEKILLEEQEYYDTKTISHHPEIDLKLIDHVVFPSNSCKKAFEEKYS